MLYQHGKLLHLELERTGTRWPRSQGPGCSGYDRQTKCQKEKDKEGYMCNYWPGLIKANQDQNQEENQ